MSHEKPGWIDTSELFPRVSIQAIAAYYRFAIAGTFTEGGEQRMRCPATTCDGHQDERSVSVNASDPSGPWKCHRGNYGCGAQGDKLKLAYCMKYGEMPPGGKLSGSSFLEIGRELQAIADGVEPPAPNASPQQATSQTEEARTIEQKRNVPLTNEKLVQLDKQLVVDPSEMTPLASAYFRKREWLTGELCRSARCGYMPGRAKSTLRGKWVFGVFDEQGRPLCWAGRNLGYERDVERHRADAPTPAKYKFPKIDFFRRRFELYGQEHLAHPGNAEILQKLGLIVVEGFNDVLRLRALQIPSVGLMSNQATAEQIKKIVRFGRQYGGGRVHFLLDANTEGDQGAERALWRVAEAGLAVRTLWSSQSHGGQFKGRETESLTPDEWQVLAKSVTS